MELFELLSLKQAGLLPESSKIHLAVWNGEENPLNVYLAGDFEEWQTWQSKKNFERENIVSLIQLPAADKWLFAGAYRSSGCELIESENYYKYKTSEIQALVEFSGRIVVDFKRSGRNSYLLAENWAESIAVSEIYPERVVVGNFESYSNTSISKDKLDLVVNQNLESWRSALSAVSGVYLITDTHTGKLYVGSATGEGGIWQRWCDYSSTGHGGNKDLMALLKHEGKQYSAFFQYTILEIADTHTSTSSVVERESYWKGALSSKKNGYNAN